jgi:DNA-binding GntR family transcriptional regulator
VTEGEPPAPGEGPTAPSKSQHAYEVIKSRIVDGSYSAGYRLVLDRLARELQVSPVPVREAVRRLEAEQFVQFERNVGARVTGVNPTEYRHAMQTLAIVEGAATGLAAPLLGEAGLTRAAELNRRLSDSLRDFDPMAFTALNREFHQVLCGPCPNPQLTDLVERGWARMATIRDSSFVFIPGRAAESVAEHHELLRLIGSGADSAVVEAAAREHRLATLRAFLSRGGTAEGDRPCPAPPDPDRPRRGPDRHGAR